MPWFLYISLYLGIHEYSVDYPHCFPASESTILKVFLQKENTNSFFQEYQLDIENKKYTFLSKCYSLKVTFSVGIYPHIVFILRLFYLRGPVLFLALEYLQRFYLKLKTVWPNTQINSFLFWKIYEAVEERNVEFSVFYWLHGNVF